MNYSYIIIDDDQESVLKTKAVADSFSELTFLAVAHNYEDGLNLILEHTPNLVFLEIDPADKKSNLSLQLINELYRYLKIVPRIIVTTSKKELAFEAIGYEVADYLLKPLNRIDLVKSILKLNKSNTEPEAPISRVAVVDEKPISVVEVETKSEEKPLILCIKSYGDYRYIDAKDVCYFQADNNSTDIYLNNGEMITAFKTLKHFEQLLPFYFFRIHHGYVINVNHVSRINLGKSRCYLLNNEISVPFSRTYKEAIDTIIIRIS